MKIVKYNWLPFRGADIEPFQEANLVLVIGNRLLLEKEQVYQAIQPNFRHANIVFCSSSGEIWDNELRTESILITAIQFHKTKIKTAKVNVKDYASSYEAGEHLYQALSSDDLKHILVFSDGQVVNGSELVKGMNKNRQAEVTVSGAMAGDDERFERTYVGLNQDVAEGNVVGVGLYGDAINIGYGSYGGWDAFGATRNITKSIGNVLYELDGKNALEIYKSYLGDEAAHLPGSALKFPLAVQSREDGSTVTRTVLGVNEKEGTMTFAGDMPLGSQVQFMKGGFQKLITAAESAAKETQSFHADKIPQLAFVASCIGRKIILGNRTREELEMVRNVLGFGTRIIGFYSYGEICPIHGYDGCRLHNQTMTVTTLAE